MVNLANLKHLNINSVTDTSWNMEDGQSAHEYHHCRGLTSTAETVVKICPLI